MTLQEEHKAWLNRMYPNQPIEVPAAGLVEEAGELVHVLLKREQERIWGPELRYSDVDWDAKLRDAVGDCGIYVCSMCNTMGWSFIELLEKMRRCDPMFCYSSLDGACSLVEAGIKVVREPYIPMRLLVYLVTLNRVCTNEELDLVHTVQTVWEEVKQRCRC